MKCCSYPNIFDLVFGKEMKPGSCRISLFNVSRKMIIFSRQTLKEGEYFALLIFLGTNNLFGKWCLFMLFLFCIVKQAFKLMLFCFKNLQIGNSNKTILIIVIGLKTILYQNLVKSVLDKKDKSVPVYTLLFNFVCLQLQCVMCLLNYLLCLWIIRHVCNLFNRE